MTRARPSIVEFVGDLTKERSLLKDLFCQARQRGELNLAVLWSFLDGVYEAPVAAGAAG